jgi:hypothetical protein
MEEPKTTADKSQTPKRPRCKLHLSTWIVVFLTTGVLVLLILPGEIEIRIVGEGTNFNGGSVHLLSDVFHHGWPWEYFDRFSYDRHTISTEEELESAPWLIFRTWSFSDKEQSFSPVLLLLDIIVAIGIIFFVTFFIEWRRRRGLRIWQFTLLELFLLTLLVAVTCSWWLSHYLHQQKEQELIAPIEQLEYVYVEKEYDGPVFLKKLIGLKYLQNFYLVTSISYDDIFLEDNNPMENKIKFDALLTRIIKLQYLESLSITSNDFLDKHLIYGIQINGQTTLALPNLKRLKHLTIYSDNITDQSVEFLEKLTQLEELDIQSTKITKSGVEKLRIALPQCEISSPME